jgi:hypothetical protein
LTGILTGLGQPDGRTARTRALDETCAEAAMRNPGEFRANPGEENRLSGGRLRIELLPYALVRVDL